MVVPAEAREVVETGVSPDCVREANEQGALTCALVMDASAQELPVAVLVVGDVEDRIAIGDMPADECCGARRVLEVEAVQVSPRREVSPAASPSGYGKVPQGGGRGKALSLEML